MLADTDFPGGNALIEVLAEDEAEVRPDLRRAVGTWVYWYVRVRDCAGRRLRVRIVGDTTPPVAARGPAVSLDEGRTWRWLGASAVQDGVFAFDVPQGCPEVRFSVGMPYTTADLERFLARFEGQGGLERRQLTRSEGGRSVALLTCRPHSCEMVASHVLEGAMEHVLGSADPAAQWLREHVELAGVPFVDLDGVEAGDQGKNRAPHDHGRDYGPTEGIYASVRAIRDLLRDPTRPPFDAVLDLRCPNITARATDERVYFAGSPDAGNWARVERLGDELR